MKIEVYVFAEKQYMVDPDRMHPIDDHLIKILHIESVFDKLVFAGELKLEKLRDLGLSDEVRKLVKYREVMVKDEEKVRKILRELQQAPVKPEGGKRLYVVLRLK